MLLFMYVCPVAKCCEKKMASPCGKGDCGDEDEDEDSTYILNAKLRTFGAV
jgi:hypothetical protein